MLHLQPLHALSSALNLERYPDAPSFLRFWQRSRSSARRVSSEQAWILGSKTARSVLALAQRAIAVEAPPSLHSFVQRARTVSEAVRDQLHVILARLALVKGSQVSRNARRAPQAFGVEVANAMHVQLERGVGLQTPSMLGRASPARPMQTRAVQMPQRCICASATATTLMRVAVRLSHLHHQQTADPARWGLIALR